MKSDVVLMKRMLRHMSNIEKELMKVNEKIREFEKSAESIDTKSKVRQT
jgi:hypothetical protein